MKTLIKVTSGWALLVGVLFTLVFAVHPVHAETVKINVPKAMVVGAFNTALNMMEVKVDNYGPKSGTSWLKQQSFVRMPDGSKKSFSIPERTTDITNTRRWRHYVDDFNTSSMSVVADEGIDLIFKLDFESQGEEVKGKCLVKRFGSWKECSLDMERDFHINNTLLRVQVTLTPHLGTISYKNPKATFKADVSIPNRLCKVFGGLCSKIANLIFNGIRDGVENAIESALNSNSIRNAVADAVKSKIPGFIDPKWQVTKIEAAGSNYRVTVERPDTIDQNSVTINSFSVIQEKATIHCPGEVKFKATISTTTKMNGTVFLVNENGKSTKSMPWSMPKKGSATSTISRTWKSNDFKAHNGWSRMVVKWKGTDGKTYSKTSAKATFTRTCSKSASGSLKFK